MFHTKPHRFFVLASLTFLFIFPSHSNAALSKSAMVATAHSQATSAALAVLNQGGNAVDAAIAAQWVLNVVEPQSSGIGGGGFFLFYEAATKRVYAFDGRELAPAGMDPKTYLDEQGVPFPHVPDRVTGGHSVGVPGTLKLLKTVHERFGSGRISFAGLFQPAIELARTGFAISPRLGRLLDEQKERLALFESTRKIFFDANGQPLKTGDLLVQKDLAETFRLIQDEGIAVFYEGAIADAIVDAVRQAPYRPGRMTKTDLFYYDVAVREAVHGEYRGFDILSMGPPSSGGTTLIETLHILENEDIGSMAKDAAFFHFFAEAQKRAFQDRNRYLGDPKFSQVPVERLLSKELSREHWQAIRANLPAAAVPAPVAESTHTSHISVVDMQGNMVAFTTTIEHIFGSAMIVPGRGFFLNNELSDFDSIPLTAEGKMHPNAPAGVKRPRSSMTPTFVFYKGEPILILGSPGGATIIGSIVNVLVNILDFKMNLSEALRAPRLINRDGPTEVESALFRNPEVFAGLTAQGHDVQRLPFFGNVQAIQRDPESGMLTGASDPRGEGTAAGI